MKVPVLIARIFDHPHTYFSGKFEKLNIGAIVSVPFGKDTEIGVVWDKVEETNKKFQIKPILEKKTVSFNKSLVEFINWFSIYNLVPKGMALKMCLGDKSLFSKKPDLFKENTEEKKIKFNLNTEQNKCLDDIKKFGNKFNVTLLQGVTGSGKTIVYFEKIKRVKCYIKKRRGPARHGGGE